MTAHATTPPSVPPTDPPRTARPGPRARPGPPPPFDDAADLVGNTPLLRVRSVLADPGAQAPPGSASFWAKLEGRNPGGLKGRAALGMVLGAERRGALHPGGTIIESTSGTLGLALAFVGVTRGYRVILVGDPGLEPMVRALLRAHGVELDLVDEPDPVGGWQEARRRRVAARCREHPGSFWPDQYDNPDNPSGYAVLFVEITVDDPSTFESELWVEGEERHGYRILRARSSTVPNAIAALLLHLREETGRVPHVYFEWTEGSPATNLGRYLLFGVGEVAPVAREVLREAEPDRERRPAVHVG